jgi:hypothetical protein
MDFAVRVSGGRTLAVRDAGDPAGTPVLVQSGTPGSRYLYGPNVEDAGMWQVLGSNQRRLSRRFYSPSLLPEVHAADQPPAVRTGRCGCGMP